MRTNEDHTFVTGGAGRPCDLLAAMRWLWLTLADTQPTTNGQYLYSHGLIRAVASLGIELDVFGLTREDGRHRHGDRESSCRWWLADGVARPQWKIALSRLPMQVARAHSPALEERLFRYLAQFCPDAIVFDSYCHAWAMPRVLERCRRFDSPPSLVYVSHNHETGIAWKIARDEPSLVKRQIKRVDAVKSIRLERRVVGSVGIVTSNTPEDCAAFRAMEPDKPVVYLPPGYDGVHVTQREITGAVPRRAVIVGSFDWSPKRITLEQFLAVADPMFAKAGVELFVVGAAEESFLEPLRRGVSATTLTGRVEDVVGYMANARLAVVPDRLGGFKLKALDYVFNRLPILAMAGSIPGMPLENGTSVLTFASHAELARGVLDVIDDLPRLNRMQALAYERCREEFDWLRIGRRLVAAVGESERAHRASYRRMASVGAVY